MGFVRPELASVLLRWREAIVWASVLVLGLGLIWRGYARVEIGTLVAGMVAAASGLALLRGARARMRLAAPPGPGVAVVDEGRIALFGPAGGGFVDLADLASVEVAGEAEARAWLLRTAAGGALVVPFGAVGAERIPDALAALPGFDLSAAGERSGVVWRAEARPALGRGEADRPRLTRDVQ